MFKNAINEFVNNRDKPEKTRKKIVFNTLSIFNEVQKQTIYDHIKNVNPKVIVNNNLEAQKLLGVRRQCKEWVDWIANNNGGKSIPYKNTTKTLTAENAASGKAVYLKSPIHSAIIIKVNRENSTDGTTKVESIEIAESNWASAWSHPVGQVPWKRMVKNRIIKLKEFKNWKIGDIDKK